MFLLILSHGDSKYHIKINSCRWLSIFSNMSICKGVEQLKKCVTKKKRNRHYMVSLRAQQRPTWRPTWAQVGTKTRTWSGPNSTNWNQRLFVRALSADGHRCETTQILTFTLNTLRIVQHRPKCAQNRRSPHHKTVSLQPSFITSHCKLFQSRSDLSKKSM